MAFEAQGSRGELFVGYQRAADLVNWSIKRRDQFIGDDVTLLEATAANVDQFWLDGAEKVVVKLRMSACWWVWSKAELASSEPVIAVLHGTPSYMEV